MLDKNLLSRFKTRATKTFAFVLLLLFSLSAIVALVPLATAHLPSWQIPTYAYLNVEPNPIGLNQQVQVSMWLDKVPPTANVQYGDRWENMTVTVTRPDGTSETLGPFTTSDVGATDTRYTPTSLGTYYFQLNFPGQVLEGKNPPPAGNTNAFINDTYLPSQSQKVALVVQPEPIEPYPTTPLPSGYWQRPINGMNSNWQSIAGDWLMSSYDGLGNRFNPYCQAPDSAHIVWTYPVDFGGVQGNPTYEDWNYYTGLAYQAKFNTPLIMYGRLIFNLPQSDMAGQGGAVCIDLHTGEEAWRINGTSLSFGQEFDYNSPNQFGVIPYLWSSGTTVMFATTASLSLTAFNPFTGQPLFTIANATSGTRTFGPSGEILAYTLNSNAGYLLRWNSTKCIMHYYENINAWMWRPQTVTAMDWKWGIEWNTTINKYVGTTGLSISKVSDDVILAATGSIATGQNWQWEVGYSTKDGSELWAVNRTTPMGATTWALMGPANNDVYTEFYQSTTEWYGFNIHTGAQMWGPTEPYPKAFGMYSWQASIGYDMLLALDFGGYVHAYDINTGTKVWDFYAGSSGLETAYGSWPLNNPAPTSADGKIYVVDGHAYNPPIYKGASLYGINATDGTLLWKSLGFYTYDNIAVADGFLVAYNCYDAQVYCYGAGRSATTVSAPELAVSFGDPVLIKGTVTDQSPGDTCLGVPAAGTPAISDANMTVWMNYLYQQQPKPENAMGVPVHLTAIDPNGNTQDIGTPISNALGNYAYSWVPPVPGLYTVKATFEGSNSYYSSEAGTSFVVSKAASVAPVVNPTATAAPITQQTSAPTVAPTQAPSPAPVTQAAPTYETIYIAVVAVVIIVIVVAAALILRRRRDVKAF